MKVDILLDSISPFTGIRLTTFALEYPQNIHQQVLTHRMFSRNSMSLRAMSFERVAELPIAEKTWTLEKKGMVGELADTWESNIADSIVARMRNSVLRYAIELKDLGIHHQDINDYLRPFLNIQVVLSSTEWDNWFTLRLAKDAKPDIYNLALAMKEAMEDHRPEESYDHIPVIEDISCNTEDEYQASKKISAARLARYSYMKFSDNVEADLKLADKLIANKHASPFEHIATATEDDNFYNNFRGWRQLRKDLGL